MPAERADLCRGFADTRLGGARVAHAGRLEIDTDSAHAFRFHILERAEVGRLLHHRDAARTSSDPAQRVEHAGVVGAIETRLHQHHPLDLQRLMQLRQHLGRSRRRGIDPVGNEGIFRRLADDMHVAIAGACGNIEINRRLDGVGGSQRACV